MLASHGVHTELVATCGNPYVEILSRRRSESELRSSSWDADGAGGTSSGGSLAIQLAGRSHHDVLVVA